MLENPKQEAPPDLYEMTKAPSEAPDVPAKIEIEFENGNLLLWPQVLDTVWAMYIPYVYI